MKTRYLVPFRRVLIVCAMAVLISPLPAQSHSEGNRERAAARFEELKDRLKLTPDQVERARPVLEREAQEIQDALRGFDRDSASMREKRKLARQVRSIREDADKQLKDILTPAQMDELKRIREERKKEMRERRRGNA